MLELLAEMRPSGESVLEKPFPEGLHPREGIHHRGVCELQPMGRPQVGEVNGRLSPMGETPCLEKGKSVSPPSEEKMWQIQHELTDHNLRSLSP